VLAVSPEIPAFASAHVAGAVQARKGDETVKSIFIDKASVVEVLRARELHGRADWLDREMPAFIDIIAHAALLRTLGVDAEAMLARDAVGDSHGEPVHTDAANGR
jgi:hypothetical protein